MSKLRILIALLAVLVLSSFATSKVLASLTWADTHDLVNTAFGGTASPVTHFYESGQESCYSPGLACYFVVYWFYWNGSGWTQFGQVSHSTDLNWPYDHASRLAGQNWPNLLHGYPGSDIHGEWPYYSINFCYLYVAPVTYAYDNGGNVTSFNNSANYVYHTTGC